MLVVAMSSMLGWSLLIILAMFSVKMYAMLFNLVWLVTFLLAVTVMLVVFHTDGTF